MFFPQKFGEKTLKCVIFMILINNMPLLFKCLIWGYVLFDICSNTVCFNLFQKHERTYLRHEIGLKPPLKLPY